MKKLRYDRVIIITVLVALLSIFIALAVLSNVKNQLVKVTAEDYKKQQTLLANQVAETLSNNLVNVQNQLRIMATMPEVKNIDDQAQCNNKLDELLRINQKQLGNLARTDPSGRFVCSVNRAIIGQDSSQYGSYISDLIKDPAHMPALSRLTKPTGVESFAAGLHVPVIDGSTFRGTLGGALYFDKFQDVYLRGIKFGNSGHVVILDDNGDILYHPDSDLNGKNLLDPRILSLFEPQDTMRSLQKSIKVGNSGAYDYSLKGTRKHGILKSFKVPDVNRHWGVLVTIPVEDIEHVVNQAGINKIFIVLVTLFTFSTALLTFVSLRNIIKNREVQRMKDEFISITSHQLRTPATIVKQYLGMLKGGFVTSKSDTKKFLESAYESNEDQLGIIENILSVSRLGAGHLELQKESVVLQELINKVTASLKTEVDSKNHKLKLKMPAKPLRLQADSTKLTMAIENLIGNAIKYTPAKGAIIVKASRQKDIVVIAVKDNGNGIQRKEIRKLFKRFNRLDSAVADQVPGTGLGLYLTKKVVDLHGGKITVESKENSGSTFTITLPIA